MAIFSLQVTAYSRSRGESMVPKSAYRSGDILHDHRTGRTADYSRRTGIEQAFMIFPHGLNIERERAWNDVERREARRDSCVGRQVLLALPAELSVDGRLRCSRRLAQWIVDQNETFVDCAVHHPNRKGDQRNFHLHILFPTRCLDPAGNLTSKLRPWDDLKTGPLMIKQLRAKASEIANDELACEGRDARIDHRSNKDRQIDERPGVKLGLAAIGFERRTGEMSSKRLHIETPIEIDMNMIAALETYQANRFRHLKAPTVDDKIECNEAREHKRPDFDIRLLLLKLKRDADLQIKRHITSHTKTINLHNAGSDRPFSSFARRSPPVSFRGRGIVPESTSRLIGYDFTRPHRLTLKEGVPVAADPIANQVPTFSAADMAKVYAFSFAVLEATSEASIEEKNEFLRKAILIVASDLGVSAQIIKTEVGFCQRLIRENLGNIVGWIMQACQIVINSVAAKIAQAAVGYRVSPDMTLEKQLAETAKPILLFVKELATKQNKRAGESNSYFQDHQPKSNTLSAEKEKGLGHGADETFTFVLQNGLLPVSWTPRLGVFMKLEVADAAKEVRA